MKKFDWFTILGALAIAENTILMIVQSGWFTVAGLIFGGIWAWVAYWDWKHKRIASSLDAASRSRANDIQAMSEVFRRLGSSGVTIDEFSSALNNSCQNPQFVGDVTCKWNS